jgi:ABC-2 type transport system permease protein
MAERLWRILVKEFIQLFRDPRMRGVILGTPIMQLVVLGYAVTMDVRSVRTVVADFDGTQESRELVRRFESSGYFTVVARAEDARAITRLFDSGRVKVALEIERGFSTDLARGRLGRLQVIVDGTDSNTASVVASYANRIVAEYSQDAGRPRAVAVPGTVADAPAAAGGLELRARAWYNPELESRNFYVPGIIAILVMLTSLLLTSMSIVREREIGTMEQLLVTPIRPAELILGKTIPCALIGFFDVGLVTALAAAWFEVPIRGSLGLLFLASGLYLLSAIGVGLFISTVSRTQQQALMSTFFFFQPAMLLSGFVFPVANMPEVIQAVTLVNPLRYYLVVIRGIFLKGSGLAVLWPELTALAVLGVSILALSTLRSRKRLE